MTRPTVGRTIGPVVRRVAAALAVLVLLVGASGCTGGSEDRTPASSPRPSLSSRPAPSHRPVPASAPLRVRVTHVAGRLPPARRHALTRRVRHVVSDYLDAAFLGGRYPRTDFDGALTAFTRRARDLARRDEGLLTNRSLGASTRWARATHRAAYLSVVAPRGHVAGVTAALDVTVAVDRGNRPGRRVRLGGRLLLTRTPSGRWAIFGYDLHRSQGPLRSAS